jgi:hypothetical protein
MENASKALIMAGGVLIALMIIGAVVLMATNLSDYKNSQDEATKSSQIAEFNNQFMPYDKDDLTLMELKTLYNKIESNNKKNPDEKISTNIVTASGGYSAVYSDLATRSFSEIEEEDKINKVFKCIKIEYENSSGKISAMYFKDVTPKKST